MPYLLVLILPLLGCSESRFQQSSSSMSPTIQPNEIVVADMSAFRNGGPQRWEVVVFHPPDITHASSQFWVMRVIGLPGEILDIHTDGIYIDGRNIRPPGGLASIPYGAKMPEGTSPPMLSYPYKISTNSYFLIGDNTTNSFDSRFWGALPRKSILGRVQGK